jgi:DNA (cytosine-5)-methyltransferase 1
MARGRRPTVVSTFAGCGGSSLGYRMAGFKELLAVEWDPNACETFKANFHGVPVHCGDIAGLSIDECARLAGLGGPGELDVLDGSPPCQGFSMAGRREIADNRNQLFRQFVRLLRGLRPRAFIMENVAGMVSGAMKTVFSEICGELSDSGYAFSVRKMDASFFGVASSRVRVIIAGWAGKRDLTVWPDPDRTRTTFGRGVSDVKNDRGEVDFLVRLMKTKWKLGLAVEQLPLEVAFGRVAPGMKGTPGFQTEKISPDVPFPTISKLGCGNLRFGSPVHWSGRKITVPEAKAIMSYPQAFVFPGEREWWASDRPERVYARIVGQIGNSVAPEFMRRVSSGLLPGLEAR